MKKIVMQAALAAAVLAPVRASAHFVWAVLDSKASTLHVQISETPGNSVVPFMKKLFPTIRTFGSGPFSYEPNGARVSAQVKAGTKVAGLNCVYGLHGTSWVDWSAKGAANLDAAAKPIGMPYEILLKKTKDATIATVMAGGKAVGGGDIEVYAPGKSPLQAKVGADGTFNIGSLGHGVLYVGAVVLDKRAGTVDGTHYSEKMHLTSVSVSV